MEFTIEELRFIRDSLGDTIDVMEDTIQNLQRQSEEFGDREAIIESVQKDLVFVRELHQKTKLMVPIGE